MLNLDLIESIIEDFIEAWGEKEYAILRNNNILNIKIGKAPWLRSTYRRGDMKIILEDENYGLKKLFDILLTGIKFKIENEELLD